MGSTELSVPTALGEVHVTATGQGEAITLWPSLLMDGSLWHAQVEHFAGRYRTIVIDPPGHGLSEPLRRCCTFEECADCVIDVLDALGIEQTHFIGNSWGAMTGGVLAAKYPSRVRTAILMNGTASAAPTLQKLQFMGLLVLARLLGAVRPPLTGGVLRAFLGPTSLNSRPDVVRRVIDSARNNNVASASYAVRSVVLRRPDNHALFAQMSCPTLVVAGREDRTFPVAELASLARVIPGAELVVIDDAAHLVAIEAPETVNALVHEFLATHRTHG